MPLELTELTDVMKSVAFKVFSGPGQPARRARRGAARAGRRRAHARRDRRLHRVREELRREGPRLDQGERCEPVERDRAAVADREEPVGAGAEGGDRALRREERRPPVLRRGQGEGRERRARRAARQDRARARPRGERAGSRCGCSISRCSSGTRKRSAGTRCTIRSPRPPTATRTCCSPNPAAARAKAHDMVLNGWEIGGGSVRIHRREVQSKVFEALGIGPDEAQAKFGFLLDALQYGAPPHGGIAFGLDRIVALMAGRGLDPRRDRVSQDAARAVPAHAARRARWTRSSCASCTSACGSRSRRTEPPRRQE